MKRQLIYISLFFSVALYSCKEDTITGEPPQENIPEDITELKPVENYPGLILRAEMYDIYKQRFEMLPVNSPAKKNKIVKAMFSDSETEKKECYGRVYFVLERLCIQMDSRSLGKTGTRWSFIAGCMAVHTSV